MPFYDYNCTACRHEQEEFHSMSEDRPECPKCGSIGTYQKRPGLTHTDIKEFAKPIAMHSLGLAHSDEINAFRRRNPDVKVSSDVRDPMYGVPIAHTRKEKLSILKTEGWEEKARRSEMR